MARTYFRARDGAVLPYRRWVVGAKPEAIVIAVHGFNDYSRFFELPGTYLRRHGIASYAYDQRGFGGAPLRGVWPGSAALVTDLHDFTRAVAARHPGVPVYWLGESMGAAVVVNAVTAPDAPVVTGAILSAPAVWARETMPWYQRSLLWLAGTLAPGVRLTGESANRTPTDNLEVLRQFGRDPLIIKETRVDGIVGLADLMDSALSRSARIQVPTLVLYGQKDQIVPPEPVRMMLNSLPPALRHIGYYQEGYHLLLRDLQAPRLWSDVLAWITNPAGTLPSGADEFALAWTRSPSS